MKPLVELADGEEVVKKVKKSPWTYSGRILGGLVFILLPLFFMLPLFSYGNFGIGLFLASLLLGAFWWLKVGWLLQRNYLLITSFSLVDVDLRRSFQKRVQRHDFSQLRGLKWKQRNLWQKMWNYGDIVFKMKGRSGVLILRSVPDPAGLKDLLVTTIRGYWEARGYS